MELDAEDYEALGYGDIWSPTEERHFELKLLDRAQRAERSKELQVRSAAARRQREYTRRRPETRKAYIAKNKKKLLEYARALYAKIATPEWRAKRAEYRRNKRKQQKEN